jgi:hypothetical protein
MALTAQDWKTNAQQLEKVRGLPQDELMEKLRTTGAEAIPRTVTECLADRVWRLHLRLYLDSEHSTESLNFIDDVDAFKAGGSAAPSAQDIYDRYVKTDATEWVNLSDPIRKAIVDAFTALEMEAYTEALGAASYDLAGMLLDSYRRFLQNVMSVQADMAAPGKVAYVGRPQKIESPQGPPQKEEIDAWNVRALQELRRNMPTDFFQLGPVVIVANPAVGAPPGIGWAQQQEGVVVGKITKKGGVFGGASILAEGVKERDRIGFEDAIRFGFDGRIDYPDTVDKPISKMEPGTKPNPFARSKVS